MIDWKLMSEEEPPKETTLLITGSNGHFVCQDFFTYHPYTRKFTSIIHPGHYTIEADEVKHWALVPHGPDFKQSLGFGDITREPMRVGKIQWFDAGVVLPTDFESVMVSFSGRGAERDYRWNPGRGGWEYYDHQDGDWYRSTSGTPRYWAREPAGPLD